MSSLLPSSLSKLSPGNIVLLTAVVASTVSVISTLVIQGQLHRIKRRELEDEIKTLEKRHVLKPVQLNEYGVPITEDSGEGAADGTDSLHRQITRRSSKDQGGQDNEPVPPPKIPLFGIGSESGNTDTTSSNSTLFDTPPPSSLLSSSSFYPPPKPLQFDEELIEEQLARNIAFLGEDGYKNVRNTFVVVIGAGGVGSWAATMLVRSGIRKLRIIDFDQVTLSSLNRHATATLSDVGRPKVHCIADFLQRVAPWCEIEPVVGLWDKSKPNYDSLLTEGDPDWIVDAIDNIDTKVDLLEYCYKNLMDPNEYEEEANKNSKRKKKYQSQANDSRSTKKHIKVISAMGAGAKSDPTRVSIGDISYSLEDPLARSTRRRLKQRGVMYGIPTVFSTEKPSPEKAALLPLSDEAHAAGQTDELAILQDFRVRILPVLGPLPAIFGLTIATHILTISGGYPGITDPLQGGYSLAGKRRYKLYDSVLQSLAGQMARLNWDDVTVPVDLQDVEYLVEEVFRGKSVISGKSTRLALTLWERPPFQPGTEDKMVERIDFDNLVVLTKDEQKVHEAQVLVKGRPINEVYDQHVLDLVKKRFDQEKYYSQFR